LASSTSSFQRLELLVNTGEADVCDLIDPSQPVGHKGPDHRRRHLAVVGFEDLLFDLIHDAEQLALRTGRLKQARSRPETIFGPIPRHPSTVLLDDDQLDSVFDAFCRS
jgi:hypothetical protein